MSKDAFRNEVFNSDTFAPSTNLGRFSAKLTGKTGELEIGVRMSLYYNEKYYQFAYPKKGEGPDKGTHASTILERFFDEAKKIIPSVWNGKFKINCVKKDWEDVVVTPRFTVSRDAMPDEAHYQVEVLDRNKEMQDAEVLDFPKDEKTKAHFAHFTEDVVDPTASEGDRTKFMVQDLVRGFDIPWSSTQGLPLARNAVNIYFRQFDQLLGSINQTDLKVYATITCDDKAFAKIRDDVKTLIPVQLLETGQVFVTDAKDEKAKQGPPGVHLALRQFDGFAGKPPDVEKICLLIKNKARRTPQKEALHFSQDVIAHEFGHMLGLPDEYVCLMRGGFTSMRNLGFIEAAEGFETQRWLDLQNPIEGKPPKANPTLEANQQKFIELCGRARMQPPLFGRRTTSLMSAGADFLPHHALTVWECLTDLTKKYLEPNDWKIEMGH